jgi:hypothetical protein
LTLGPEYKASRNIAVIREKKEKINSPLVPFFYLISLYYGMEQQEYTIKFWETEEDRDEGNSNIHIPRADVNRSDRSEMIAEARRLYDKQDFVSVEVEDEESQAVFHISTEVPQGEEY